LGPRPDPLQPQRLRHDRTDGAARIERGVRILEHELDLAPEWAQGARTRVCDRRAVVDDLAGRGLKEAGDETGDGGLSAARLAYEAERPPAGALQPHAVHGVPRPPPA